MVRYVMRGTEGEVRQCRIPVDRSLAPTQNLCTNLKYSTLGPKCSNYPLKHTLARYIEHFPARGLNVSRERLC